MLSPAIDRGNARTSNSSNVSHEHASAVAYVAFYHRLFKGDAVGDAVVAMRAAAGNDTFEIMYGADLKAVWRSYVGETEKQFIEMLERAGTWKSDGGGTA